MVKFTSKNNINVRSKTPMTIYEMDNVSVGLANFLAQEDLGVVSAGITPHDDKLGFDIHVTSSNPITEELMVSEIEELIWLNSLVW